MISFKVFCDLVKDIGGRMNADQINEAAPHIQQILVDNPELLRASKLFITKKMFGSSDYTFRSLDGEFMFTCGEDQLEQRIAEQVKKGWKHIKL